MFKKNFLAITSGILFLLLLGNYKVFALPVFQPDDYNFVYFSNVENWIDVDNDGKVTKGDYFFGILHVQDIVSSPGTMWNEDNTDNGDLDTLTGYFLTTVKEVVIENGSTPHFELSYYTAGSDPNGILTDDEIQNQHIVLKLWTDDSTPFEYNGDLNDDLTKATDGTPFATFTIDDGYWYTHAPLIPPVNPGSSVGESWLGLNIVYDATGIFQGPNVNDPEENEKNLDVTLYANSEITVSTSPINTAIWHFQSNDPATFYAVPEPASLLLLGSGLLGAGLFGKKRRNKA